MVYVALRVYGAAWMGPACDMRRPGPGLGAVKALTAIPGRRSFRICLQTKKGCL